MSGSKTSVSFTSSNEVTGPNEADSPNEATSSKRQKREASANGRSEAKTEPMLNKSITSLVLMPERDKELWALYKKQQAMIWKWEEIPMGQDRKHWAQMKPEDKQFVLHVLAFFAGADGIVFKNLLERFMEEVQLPESRCFFALQMHMEMVHAETYTNLLDFFCENAQEKHRLFHAIEQVPSIKRKADWAIEYIESEDDFGRRLVAFIAVEGIMFSGSFCALFWNKKRGLLPGLSFSNELISKDEGLHVVHLVALFLRLKHPPSEQVVKEIFSSAMECELDYINEGLKVALIGMNAKNMKQYEECVVDRLLLTMRCSKMYNSTNPFAWMENMGLLGIGNFFEVGVSSYVQHGVGSGKIESNDLCFDADL